MLGGMEIEFLYYEDCPSHELARERLEQVMAEEGIQASITVIKVETEDQAERLRFPGSPTILVDGRDIDPPPSGVVYALTCRAYRKEDGRISPLPSRETINRALLKRSPPSMSIEQPQRERMEANDG